MEAYRKSILEYDDVRDAVDFAREEGLKKGMEKGETNKQRDIALNCLKNGLGSELISTITGLSIDEINKLNLEFCNE